MEAKPTQEGDGLDPLIHERARLLLVSILAECAWAEFTFLLNSAKLTRGNLATHLARLVAAGYVQEQKRFVARKPQTQYCLTPRGRASFDAYKSAWMRTTGARRPGNAR